LSAAAGVMLSSDGSTGIRSPEAATDLLGDLSRMLAAWISWQPDRPAARAAARVSARTAAPDLARALYGIIERLPVGPGRGGRAAIAGLGWAAGWARRSWPRRPAS